MGKCSRCSSEVPVTVVPRAQTIPGVDPEAARVVLLWAEVEAGAAMLVENGCYFRATPHQEAEAVAVEPLGFMQPPTPPPQTTSLPWPVVVAAEAVPGLIQTVAVVSPVVSRVVPPVLKVRIAAAAMTAVEEAEAGVVMHRVAPVGLCLVVTTGAVMGALQEPTL